ncbi:hypothetical protein Val02_82600 [Virgisporangium aliadipatigenens]|uniref:Uncharacterized protein n=1 Tax=Virgisporangium aliadipatigenens TaxID=741659 RepID=A0A8J3YTG0_9ACTN|nr:hypothetical protein [Virgisporangium aliadipatigenens]GIJ51374.1 hypothetical protein Val02_82600 [Virgisporangium aliadipatigenens]
MTSSVWGRDGLDRGTRSCITLAPGEISEVLLHSAAYAGVPNARGAMLVAERVLDELFESDG